MLTVKKRIINFQTVGSILYRDRLDHKLVSEMMLNVQSKSNINKLDKIAVITNLLTVIPYVGNDLVQYIYGSFNIG